MGLERSRGAELDNVTLRVLYCDVSHSVFIHKYMYRSKWEKRLHLSLYICIYRTNPTSVIHNFRQYNIFYTAGLCQRFVLSECT